MTRLLLIAGLCAGLLFAACGGDDDDSDDAPAAPTTVAEQGDTPEPEDEPTDEPDDGGATGSINPCDLVAPEDVEAAVGGPPGDPDRSSIGEGFDQCVMRAEGATEVDSAVVVQVREDTSRGEFDELLDENTPEALGEPKPVDGLGDVAFEQVATFVLDGDVMLVVTVINNDADGGTARQREITTKALDRLP